MNDLDTARKIAGGDRDAAERLVRDHYTGVYRTMRHLAGTREDAEDLTQQAFLAARAQIHTFRGRASLRTWLHRIAYREYAQWRRKPRRTEPLTFDHPAPEPGYRAFVLGQALLSALSTLPEGQRTAFLLHEVEEMKVAEVAQILRVPTGTVKARLFYARRRLRALLEDETETPNHDAQELLSFDESRMGAEVRALRAQSPDPVAVERTVARVLAFSPPPTPADPSIGRRFVPIAAVLGGVVLLATLTARPANAATLQSIAEAVSHQPRRHAVTYRPNRQGRLVFKNENWVDGNRQASFEVGDGGVRYLSGYDGRRMFLVHPGVSFVDDVAPSGIPVESIDSYLGIPGARVVDTIREGAFDVFKVDCRTVVFRLYVDPQTRLPARRDVLSENGRLIERNVYDYPAAIPVARFHPPSSSNPVDYPTLRREVRTRLRGSGQIRRVGSATISLKAVLVGRAKVLAVWNGAEGLKASLNLESRPSVPANFPPAFDPIWLAGHGQTLVSQPRSHVDGVWLSSPRPKGPFTLNVSLWTKDRARPIRDKAGRTLGYADRLVGTTAFKITDPIRADDPDRALWRPDGRVRTTQAAGADRQKP